MINDFVCKIVFVMFKVMMLICVWNMCFEILYVGLGVVSYIGDYFDVFVMDVNG